jgi:hypothetical protein
MRKPRTRSGPGTSRATPRGAPTSTSRETRPGSSSEHGAHEPTDRAAREVDRVQLELVEDVANERPRHGSEIRTCVVERIRETVPRQIDRKDAAPRRESPEDGCPQRGVVESTVDEHERWPVPELEHPRLLTRPPQAT